MREKMSSKSDLAQVSMIQLQTLFFLKKNKKSHMMGIAEYLQVELPSATNMISNLIKLELVERSVDKNDKRIVNITLTKKAVLLLGKVKKERTKKMGTVLSLLSEGDKTQLLQILGKLTKSVEKEK